MKHELFNTHYFRFKADADASVQMFLFLNVLMFDEFYKLEITRIKNSFQLYVSCFYVGTMEILQKVRTISDEKLSNFD